MSLKLTVHLLVAYHPTSLTSSQSVQSMQIAFCFLSIAILCMQVKQNKSPIRACFSRHILHSSMPKGTDQYYPVLYRAVALHPDEEHSHLHLIYLFYPGTVTFSLPARGLCDVSCFLHERWSLEIKRIGGSRLITDEG